MATEVAAQLLATFVAVFVLILWVVTTVVIARSLSSIASELRVMNEGFTRGMDDLSDELRSIRYVAMSGRDVQADR